MIVTVYHRKNGTYAAEVPGRDGNRLIFASSYDPDPGHSDQYEVLRAALLNIYGVMLPALSETGLVDPGKEMLFAEEIGPASA